MTVPVAVQPMPLPISVDSLVHGRAVEWERLEFKSGWNPLDILHTLCAFANDFHNLGGGYLIVGISEKEGQPVLPPIGLAPQSLDKIQKEILSMGHSALQPAYHPIVVPYEIQGQQVLILWAPGGQNRPYKARLSLAKDSRDYGYFVRKGSSTIRAKGEDETELLSLAATVPFDDRVNQQATVDDISRDLMDKFLKAVGSDLAAHKVNQALPLIDLGRQLGVVGGNQEAPFPRNVGLMFFNPEPHRFFPGTQIDVVWFPDEAGGETFTEKVFRGPLDQMAREALDYIRRNYLSETVKKDPMRAESTRFANFPFAALEEALVNAVYHRSYEQREPIEVRITPDRIEVLSYPGPDRSVKLDLLRIGRASARRYRNRRIGEILKELDLTEGRATGIPKIIRAMRTNGSPSPIFEFDDDHTHFKVTLPVHPQATSSVSDHVTEETDHATDQVSDHVSDHVASLLRVIGKRAMSTNEIMAQLSLSHRPSFRKMYLHIALEAGLIEMTIPDKPQSTKQQYRLTPKGLAWFALHEKPPGQEVGTDHATDHVSDHVSDHVASLLRVIGKRAISTNEIMAQLSLSHRPSFRKMYLHIALEAGLIEMTIPDKPQSTKQQYRLTAKGLAWFSRSGKELTQ